MIDFFDSIDKLYLIAVDSYHSPFWDQVMYVITNKRTWIPLYIVLIYFIIKQFKKRSIVIIPAIVISVLLSEQLSSSVSKPLTKRLRPCQNNELMAKIHQPCPDCGTCKGSYGFFSAHASTTFALATFLILLYRKRSKWVYTFWLWSGIIAYSRVYLIIHYLFDIVAGALVGVIIAYFLYKLSERIKFAKQQHY